MILSWLLISYITMAYIRNQILYQPKLNSNCFSMVTFFVLPDKIKSGQTSSICYIWGDSWWYRWPVHAQRFVKCTLFSNIESDKHSFTFEIVWKREHFRRCISQHLCNQVCLFLTTSLQPIMTFVFILEFFDLWHNSTFWNINNAYRSLPLLVTNNR